VYKTIDEFAEDGARMLWLWSVMRFTSNKGSRRPLALSEVNRPLALSEVNISALGPSDAFWVCVFALLWPRIRWRPSSANNVYCSLIQHMKFMSDTACVLCDVHISSCQIQTDGMRSIWHCTPACTVMLVGYGMPWIQNFLKCPPKSQKSLGGPSSWSLMKKPA
jgi:hypothetical protein